MSVKEQQSLCFIPRHLVARFRCAGVPLSPSHLAGFLFNLMSGRLGLYKRNSLKFTKYDDNFILLSMQMREPNDEI